MLRRSSAHRCSLGRSGCNAWVGGVVGPAKQGCRWRFRCWMRPVTLPRAAHLRVMRRTLLEELAPLSETLRPGVPVCNTEGGWWFASRIGIARTISAGCAPDRRAGVPCRGHPWRSSMRTTRRALRPSPREPSARWLNATTRSQSHSTSRSWDPELLCSPRAGSSGCQRWRFAGPEAEARRSGPLRAVTMHQGPCH